MTEIIDPQVKENIAQVAEDPGIIREWLESATPKVLGFLIQLVITVVVLLVGIRLINFIVRLIRRSFARSNMETGVATFLSSLIKYVLYFLLVMLVLGRFGVTTGSVVAVLGSAGLTLGLALQGSLANFAGGVLILLLKPFVVGDYIITGQAEGKVIEITIFYTKLVTLDNKAVVIPNGTLSNGTITNVSHMENRMVSITVGVDYDSNLAQVKEVLRTLADKDVRVLKDPPVQIFVAELADSSVNMEMRLWTKNENYWELKWDMTEAVKNAFDANGIKIPYPHVELCGGENN